MEFSICFWVCEEVLVHIKSVPFFQLLDLVEWLLKSDKEKKKEHFQLDTSLFKKPKHLNGAKQYGPQNYSLRFPKGTKIMNHLVFWWWIFWLSTDFFLLKWRVKILSVLRNGQHRAPGHSPGNVVCSFLGTALWHWNETATLRYWNLQTKHKRALEKHNLCKTSGQKTVLGNGVP